MYKFKYNDEENIIFDKNNFKIYLQRKKSSDHYINMEDIWNKKIDILPKSKIFANNKLKYNNIHITFFNTQNRNMDCTYCYEKKSATETKNLSLEEMIKAYKFFNKKYKPNTMSFTFFGGEPLLSFNNIKHFVNKIKNMNEINTEFYLITNGTLLNDEYIDFIIENFNGITFSIDGNKRIHNYNRKYLNGKNTYNDILKNLEKLNKKDVSIKVDLSCELTITSAYYKTGDLQKNIYEFQKPILIKKKD